MKNNNTGNPGQEGMNPVRFSESLSFSENNKYQGGFSYVYDSGNSMSLSGKATNKCTIANNCEGANCTFRCGKSSE